MIGHFNSCFTANVVAVNLCVIYRHSELIFGPVVEQILKIHPEAVIMIVVVVFFGAIPHLAKKR